MLIIRQMRVAWIIGVLFLTCPAAAQTDANEDIPLIMQKPQGAGALSKPRLKKLYEAIQRRAATAKGQLLPLTKSEVWIVPKASVEDVRKTASRHGIAMNRLSETWNQLLRRAPAEIRLQEKQRTLINRAKESLATIGVGMMATSRPPLVEYALVQKAPDGAASASSSTLTVAVTDGPAISLRRQSVELKGDMYVWRGIVDGTDESATLMWWANGRMIGTIQYSGRIYSLRHLGGELHAVVEIAEERMPSEHGSMGQRERPADPRLRDASAGPRNNSQQPRTIRSKTVRSTSEKRVGDEPSNINIDLIVAYTKKASSNYLDIKTDLIDLAVEEANESFRLSNLPNVKLRVSHAYETSYVEQGGHFDHVWRFADRGDGHMEEVHALRDKHRADVAILIVDDADGCGLATRVYADADEAFAVVHHECAATSYSIAHEIGHIIGARHDLKVDSTMTPFSFGHGYVNGTKWRDIMSYKESCNGCRRIPVWSSPLVKVRNEPAGTPELDNARVIREQAARVAAFR